MINTIKKNLYKKLFGLNEDDTDGFYEDFLAQEFILRDYLAVERTILANESTFLSYVRTSVTFVAGGVTLMQVADLQSWQNVGTVAVSLGGLFFLFGCVQAIKMSRKIKRFMKKKKEVDSNVSNE